ncbi:Microtubule-associated tumor suppressor 1-like A, partial [Ophiophagus hannah]
NFEDENAWLQEWIHEELAHGEVWQKEYEALLRHQAQLCTLLQTKSLKPLENKTRALQEELEEIQGVLQEYRNRSRQRQLHIHKQEKENQKMAEIVKELEKKVFKQQMDEQSNEDALKELRSEGNELKKQQHIEKLSTVIQGLSLKSQLFPTSNSPGCLEAAVGLGQSPASDPAVSSASPFLSWRVLQAAMLAAELNSPTLLAVQ